MLHRARPLRAQAASQQQQRTGEARVEDMRGNWTGLRSHTPTSPCASPERTLAHPGYLLAGRRPVSTARHEPQRSQLGPASSVRACRVAKRRSAWIYTWDRGSPNKVRVRDSNYCKYSNDSSHVLFIHKYKMITYTIYTTESTKLWNKHKNATKTHTHSLYSIFVLCLPFIYKKLSWILPSPAVVFGLWSMFSKLVGICQC